MMEEVGVDDHKEVTTKMEGASIADELREAAQTAVTQGTSNYYCGSVLLFHD